MQQRGRSGQPAKGRRANRPKARKGSTAAPSIADLQRQVGTLTRELKEANERQTASAEVLRVINSSPGDLAPVFDAILEKAHRLCGVSQGSLQLYDGEKFRAVAVHGLSEAFADRLRRGFRLGPNSPGQRLLDGARFVQIPDLGEIADPMSRAGFELAGVRTILFIPLRKDGTFFGRISASRPEVKPFTEMEIVLLESFAAQAVIAIENARLFEEVQARTRELSEALTYQAGSANILKVIASWPTDVGPVLTAIVESACVICEAENAHVTLKDGDELVFQAQHGSVPVVWKRQPINRRWVTGRAAVDRRPIHVHDLLSSEGDEFPDGQELARRDGWRTVLAVPLLREGECVGVIVLRRMEVRPFSEKQIELLQTFADQAVIAIGNVRLFDEVQARTRELAESLEQQTATSEVLQIISSSPGELEAVFQAMLENATRVCGAKFGIMNLYDGDSFESVALFNVPPAYVELRKNTRFRANPLGSLGTVIRTKQVAHTRDYRENPAYRDGDPLVRELVEIAGARSWVVVPMLKEAELIGVITIYRQEIRPFTDKQIELVNNFAKQAVIAIENTRLLRELRQSLQQQTATAEVLQVISSSPGDLAPVFEKMLENATRICGANFGQMNLYEQGRFRPIALYNTPAAYTSWLASPPFQPHPQSALGTVARTHQVVHIEDIRTLPPYREGNPSVVALADVAGARTFFVVPMLKENELIGAITIYRQEVRPFTDNQIDLVTIFARQAVIAIENAKLLSELRERTADLARSVDELTATGDVLKIISRSTVELDTVLDTLVETLARLCRADNTTMYRRRDDNFYLIASRGLSEEAKALGRMYPVARDRGSRVGRVAMERRPVQIPDVLQDGEYTHHELQKILGYRSTLGVPLLRENALLGIFALNRIRVEPFTEKEIELASTFADQAVIAMENARLFDELRQSLQQQTSTAEVLKVISRSAFDLGSVLQTLVKSAALLCDADKATITRQAGEVFYRAESYGFSQEFMDHLRTIPIKPERGSVAGRALLEGRAIHIFDVQSDAEYTLIEESKWEGFRTVLSVPILREGIPIGVLSLTRSKVRPFTEKQIELVSTFANQAAIAIENARLVGELR